MNYNEMPAGPDMGRLVTVELDREIAEKVMGWQASPNGASYRIDRPGGDGRYVILAHEFCPSTNIAHAWEVAEKLTASGEFVGLMWNGQQWECALNKVMRKADAAPLAICRAALMAMERK